MCVCLSVCVSVCYHIFGNIVCLYVITTIVINFTQNSLYIYKHVFFVKKLHSKVRLSFAYSDIHRCYCGNLLDLWITQPSRKG